MKTSFVKVTPSLAEVWLKKNSHNRKLQRATVSRYAADMREGRWVLTAEPITFDTEGRLMDGQHRLWAVVESDVAVDFLMVEDAPPEGYTVINAGRRRSVADALSVDGVPDAFHTAAAARLCLLYDSAPDRSWDAAKADITQPKLISYIGDNIERLILAAQDSHKFNPIARKKAYATAGLFLIARDAGDAIASMEPFMTGVHTGADLRMGDARLALRNYLVNETPGRVSKYLSTSQTSLAIVIRAWNYWLADENVTRLSFRHHELPMPKVSDGTA